MTLLAGVYEAIKESHPALVAGITVEIAEVISMGAGACLSTRSGKELTGEKTDRKSISRKVTLPPKIVPVDS
jgi:hypothetical protein